MLPMQNGDGLKTYADIANLEVFCGYKPITFLNEGIFNFIKWYRSYYKVN
jgi:UDP-glucuronate 4-epimerase